MVHRRYERSNEIKENEKNKIQKGSTKERRKIKIYFFFWTKLRQNKGPTSTTFIIQQDNVATHGANNQAIGKFWRFPFEKSKKSKKNKISPLILKFAILFRLRCFFCSFALLMHIFDLIQ
jgi:hypothetical protein